MAFKDFNVFDSHYVILTSDRLIFNSKADSIFLLSNTDVNISANKSIHFNLGVSGKQDSNLNIFIVNSPYIQLGLPKDGTNEPIAKGQSTVDFVNAITGVLNKFGKALEKAGPLISGAGGSGVFNAANMLIGEIENIKMHYGASDSPIKSKVTKSI